MSLLFTQTWNVAHGAEDQYETFISESFIPRCNELGLTSVGGFYVQSGAGPHIISIKSAASLDKLFEVLANGEFKKIKQELKQYVSNYGSRVLVRHRDVGPDSYSIQKGVWKFNQYFDLRPGMEAEYDAFMTEEFIPTVQSRGYVEFSREWNVLIGSKCEKLVELSFLDPMDIGRLLGTKAFQDLLYTLGTRYVDNLHNRILRTTERFDQARWYRL